MLSLSVALVVILSAANGTMSIVALRHVKPEERAKRSLVLLATDPWWPFHDEAFLASGKRVLLWGKLLLPLVVLAYIALFLHLAAK